jgi:hypothetical protein
MMAKANEAKSREALIVKIRQWAKGKPGDRDSRPRFYAKDFIMGSSFMPLQPEIEEQSHAALGRYRKGMLVLSIMLIFMGGLVVWMSPFFGISMSQFGWTTAAGGAMTFGLGVLAIMRQSWINWLVIVLAAVALYFIWGSGEAQISLGLLCISLFPAVPAIVSIFNLTNLAKVKSSGIDPKKWVRHEAWKVKKRIDKINSGDTNSENSGKSEGNDA